MTSRSRAFLVLAAIVLPAVTLIGCAGPEEGAAPPPPAQIGRQSQVGRPQRGAMLITKYGCGTCHEIPGIDGANGLVGPPLTQIARRSYIAGMLPNSSKNLEHWIRDPQGVVPGNAMPNLGVSARDAADITAYLYTLK